MKKLFEKYKFGIDFWGLILFALIMLPTIVYLCIPGLGKISSSYVGLDVSSKVFQVIAVALLILVVRKERAKFSLTRPLVFFAGIFLMLYYIAWIFFFCGYGNSADLLFLAVCPCVSLLLYEIEGKNWFALCPTAIFAILHVVSTLLLFV